MIKLDYKNISCKFLAFYKKQLFLSEFNTGNGRKNIEEWYNLKKQTDNEFKKVFEKYSLNDLLFIPPNELKYKIQEIESLIQEHTNSNKFKEGLKKLFKYENKFQTHITTFFKEKFDFRTCFYCNRNFITNYGTENGKIQSTFQLDHYYEKATYPYLALSFYNLIPCCSTCNTTVKNSEIKKPKDDLYNKGCIAPNSDNFNFDKEVKFKTFIKNENLEFSKVDEIELVLKEDFGDNYKEYLRIFRLNERYESHKNIVIELIQKRQKYPDSRIKELADLTHQTPQTVKEDIFGKFIFEKNPDLSKEPLSKLKLDIAKELGL